MDKWLTVLPDLKPVIGPALALYSLYRPKKKTLILTEQNLAQEMTGDELGCGGLLALS
jgi:hypothetical protein